MANWFNRGKKILASASINWGTTQVGLMLMKSTYTFDATKNFVSDISASEIVATNYARKTTITYPGTPLSQDDTAGLARLFMSNQTFTALGGATNDTIGGFVVYVFNAADNAAQLIAFVPTNSLTTAGNDVTVAPDATNGMLTIG